MFMRNLFHSLGVVFNHVRIIKSWLVTLLVLSSVAASQVSTAIESLSLWHSLEPLKWLHQTSPKQLCWLAPKY